MSYKYSSVKESPSTILQLKADPNSEEEVNIIFEALRSHRRRYILRTLHNKGALEKADLADHVAAIENKKPVGKLSEQEQKRVVVSLHQEHLPFLSKHKFIAWDRETNEVGLGSRCHFLIEHMYRIGQD